VLPPEFAAESHLREYYGTVSHNSKAVYQRYLGWLDANPANLNPHPPAEAGRKYVDFMGGADELLAKARSSFADGDYRWVSEVVNHLVFAEPANDEARLLQADALEQLGYQAESGPWRNFYLMGAQELRNGSPGSLPMRRRSMLDALSVEQIIDIIGVRMAADQLAGLSFNVNLVLTDVDEQHVLGVNNRCVHHIADRLDDAALVTVTTRRPLLAEWTIDGSDSLAAQVADGTTLVIGDRDLLVRLLDCIEVPDIGFAIIEP